MVTLSALEALLISQTIYIILFSGVRILTIPTPLEKLENLNLLLWNIGSCFRLENLAEWTYVWKSDKHILRKINRVLYCEENNTKYESIKCLGVK